MRKGLETPILGMVNLPAEIRQFTPDQLSQLADEHEVLITIEDGSIGGFSTQVTHFMAVAGLLDNGLRFRSMVLPDIFID